MNATETRAQFLSPREAAKLLGLSRQTIYRQIHRGALPAVRVGSTTIRIPARLLVSELQRTRTGPAFKRGEEHTMNHAESPPSELEQLTVGEIRRGVAR